MRIQTQNHPNPPVSRKPIPSDERAPQVTGLDMLLLTEIKSQERIMAAAHARPGAGAAVGALGTYYLAKTTLLSQFAPVANHVGMWAGGMGLPVGLLLGAGLAEYLSNNAASKIEEAEAQLSR